MLSHFCLPEFIQYKRIIEGLRWRLISLCCKREAFVRAFIREISHYWFVSGCYVVLYRCRLVFFSMSRFWNCSPPRVPPMWSGTVWKHVSTPHMSTSLTTAKSCTTDSSSRPRSLWVNTFALCTGVCLHVMNTILNHTQMGCVSLCLTVSLNICLDEVIIRGWVLMGNTSISTWDISLKWVIFHRIYLLP